MPYARTWSEELVAEWLEMKGYSVIIGLSVGTAKGGGRKEADVIGFRLKGNKLYIIHIEISVFTQAPTKIINSLHRKFSTEIEKKIEEYVTDIINGNFNIKHKRVVIAITISNKAKKEIKQKIGTTLPNMEILEFNELLNKIMLIVNNKVKEIRTFPDGFWFLNFLWYLKYQKISI